MLNRYSKSRQMTYFQQSPTVATRVQNFRVTVFQLGSNDLGDDQITDIPQDSVYSRRARALYITSLTEGHQYHVEVFASVGGVYGPPGAVDITFWHPQNKDGHIQFTIIGLQ